MRAADIVPGADYAVGDAVPLHYDKWRDADPDADRVTVLDDRLWRALSKTAHPREHDLTHGPRSTVDGVLADGASVNRGSLVVVRVHRTDFVRTVALRRVLRPWAEHEALVATERERMDAARARADEAEAAEYRDLTVLRDRLKDVLGGAPSLYRPARGGRSVVIRDDVLAALLALAETSPAAPEDV